MFQSPSHNAFDWARAIERNSEALKGVVAALFIMLGEATVQRLPESLYRAVLRVLRPAESAVRRLVVIVARGLVVKPVPPRPMPKGPLKKGVGSRPVFQLFDPRKDFADHTPRVVARIHTFAYDPRVAAMWAALPRSHPAGDGLINAKRLIRRLQALKSALDNLPRQARRLAHWRIRHPELKYKSPLRPGPPPGHRRRKLHEIDEILTECHGLAWDALKVDTS
jgi:hypothetical protein